MNERLQDALCFVFAFATIMALAAFGVYGDYYMKKKILNDAYREMIEEQKKGPSQ